jgi:dolichol-phosphate mannosyltransferase
MDVGRLYQRRFPEASRKAKNRVWEVIVRDWFQQWIRPEDTVLDIGCGYGEFLNHVHAARRVGIDFNEESRAHLDEGIEFHAGHVRQLGFLPDAVVDVVFTSNMLEHLADKKEVEEVLKEARRVLRPGGHLIALGPNLRFLPGEYWDFWDHLTPITDRSLVELLENIDFEIEDCIPRFLPYTTRSSLPQRPWMVSLYLRLPLAWRVLGRQFLVRGRKRI